MSNSSYPTCNSTAISTGNGSLPAAFNSSASWCLINTTAPTPAAASACCGNDQIFGVNGCLVCNISPANGTNGPGYSYTNGTLGTTFNDCLKNHGLGNDISLCFPSKDTPSSKTGAGVKNLPGFLVLSMLVCGWLASM